MGQPVSPCGTASQTGDSKHSSGALPRFVKKEIDTIDHFPSS